MTVSSPHHTLNATDLVDRPGASREVDLALPVPSGFSTPVATAEEPLRLHGVVESVVEGLLVRGELEARLRLDCSRCLTPMVVGVAVDVVELFSEPETGEGEVEAGYELVDGHLDLSTLLRDGLATAVPYQPLCQAGCRGLCASCGADLNTTTCACTFEDTDPRWDVLRHLHLPEER